MGSAQPGSVFVSSVFGELAQARVKVEEACELLGLEAVRDELLAAHPTSVEARLRHELARCDAWPAQLGGSAVGPSPPCL